MPEALEDEDGVEDFWQRRYEEQHRSLHAAEDEIARLRQEVKEKDIAIHMYSEEQQRLRDEIMELKAERKEVERREQENE